MTKLELKDETKEQIKKLALGAGENVAKTGVTTAIQILALIAKDTPNVIDDAVVAVLKTAEPQILAYLDKIDGDAA